ncbi:MAG: helix-turn-helix domain-containing protein [Dechloromonas sp.]|nr:MAG: helix-turn-helix domain-containing protein [Dechloromonas sp.]
MIGLIRIMANGCDDATRHVVLPTRQDIADITALRLETVSRIIKRLERDGLLRPVRIDGVHATRSFAVDFGRLAA